MCMIFVSPKYLNFDAFADYIHIMKTLLSLNKYTIKFMKELNQEDRPFLWRFCQW
jgi:hypothetical protein